MFRDGEEAGSQTRIIKGKIDLFKIDADGHAGTEGQHRPIAGVGKVELQGAGLRFVQSRFTVAAVGELNRRRITLQISAKNLPQPAPPDDKCLRFLRI